ncbi:efflux RND transporter periplasmic adaptor subunit [Paludibaculum fermentans]|uniref:efflux RND transporter periplasmic adaptor subunit n=1 Tax=Paludibaculum fermentans TaxID=1473598 RepID=UPI003EBBB6DB
MTSEVETPPTDSAPTTGARPTKTALHTLGVISLVVLAGLAGLVVTGVRARSAAVETLARSAQDGAALRVSVVHPMLAGDQEDLVLPANIQAYAETPIYARTHGYLKRWYFDIGSHVGKGDLLAEIETPEVDQQLAQARADLKSLQANLELARTTADRWNGLLARHAVSKQETDQAVSDFSAKQAAVDASMANVRRLEELQGYEKVYAPFEGVITARQTDVGALIDAGSSPRELFHLATTRKLRVFVAVPEVSAGSVRNGAPVKLTSDQFPNKTFQGVLVRNSNSIDPASRTLNVEVDIDNSAGELLPGSYAFVHLRVPGSTKAWEIPSSALLFRAEGLRVAVVRGAQAELVPISIGRDFGARVEVNSGLRPDDEVILSPSDSLVTGTPVQIAKAARK